MPTPSQYWYIACESQRLATKHPVSAQILDQWIVCFRDGPSWAERMTTT